MTKSSAAPKRSASQASVAKLSASSPASPPKKSDAADATTHRWTFLTNHAHVLIVLHDNPQMVLREVAVAVGITERAVQRIVQDLENGGFIERQRVGRRNQYRVLPDRPLRHDLEAHRSIGDLLTLIAKNH